MTGARVIRKSRKMAGLTQAELAKRLRTTPSVLSRWESGKVEPSFAAVARAIDTCKLTMVDVLAEPEVDPHDASLLETTLALTPDERLRRLTNYVRFIRAGRRAMPRR